ncbi:Fe-S cluster assembly protein SufD [Planctomycetota bacterium]
MMVTTDYKDAYQAVQKNTSTQWLQMLHDEGMAHVERVGWPTMRHEEWKYTSTKALQDQRFQLAVAAGTVDTAVLEAARVADSIELVFVDGFFQPDLSRLNLVPQGVSIETLHASQTRGENTLTPLLYRSLSDHDSMFTGLNGALLQGGLCVQIKAKTLCGPLIHVIHVTSASAGEAMVFPRQVWHVESSAQAAVLQTVISGGDAATLMSAVTDIHVESNGQLAYALVQAENLAASQAHHTRVTLAPDSRLEAFCLTTGGRWVRNDLDVTLDGSNIDAKLNGLYLPRGEQHIDNHSVIDHREPNSQSSQLYKGVLDDQSRAVFNGKIFVRDIAQQTNAYQLNRNLLLSPGAEVDTKPQLEIFADNVRCTHGATIGPVNPDEIFYLQSRGFERSQAIRTLARGFARETLSHLTDQRLLKVLTRRLDRTFGDEEGV